MFRLAGGPATVSSSQAAAGALPAREQSGAARGNDAKRCPCRWATVAVLVAADQDSVRLLVVESVGAFAGALGRDDAVHNLLPLVHKFAQVRHQTARLPPPRRRRGLHHHLFSPRPAHAALPPMPRARASPSAAPLPFAHALAPGVTRPPACLPARLPACSGGVPARSRTSRGACGTTWRAS